VSTTPTPGMRSSLPSCTARECLATSPLPPTTQKPGPKRKATYIREHHVGHEAVLVKAVLSEDGGAHAQVNEDASPRHQHHFGASCSSGHHFVVVLQQAQHVLPHLVMCKSMHSRVCVLCVCMCVYVCVNVSACARLRVNVFVCECASMYACV